MDVRGVGGSLDTVALPSERRRSGVLGVNEELKATLLRILTLDGDNSELEARCVSGRKYRARSEVTRTVAAALKSTAVRSSPLWASTKASKKLPSSLLRT